jgi:hypothetical protein
MKTMEIDHTGKLPENLSNIFGDFAAEDEIRSAMDSVDQLLVTLNGIKNAVERTAPQSKFIEEYLRRVYQLIEENTRNKDRLTQLLALNERVMNGAFDNHEQCPGCFSLPGEGRGVDCEHPDGCGYFKAIEREHAGIPQPTSAQVIDLFARP